MAVRRRRLRAQTYISAITHRNGHNEASLGDGSLDLRFVPGREILDPGVDDLQMYGGKPEAVSEDLALDLPVALALQR